MCTHRFIQFLALSCILLFAHKSNGQRVDIWYTPMNAISEDWDQSLGNYEQISSSPEDCPSPSDYCWAISDQSTKVSRTTPIAGYTNVELTYSMIIGEPPGRGSCIIDYSVDGKPYEEIASTVNGGDDKPSTTKLDTTTENNSFVTIRLGYIGGSHDCYYNEFRLTGIPITKSPSGNPTSSPTTTFPPTLTPSFSPSTKKPTKNPTPLPTLYPSTDPTLEPTTPTFTPTPKPTARPTPKPVPFTNDPTENPTNRLPTPEPTEFQEQHFFGHIDNDTKYIYWIVGGCGFLGIILIILGYIQYRMEMRYENEKQHVLLQGMKLDKTGRPVTDVNVNGFLLVPLDDSEENETDDEKTNEDD